MTQWCWGLPQVITLSKVDIRKAFPLLRIDHHCMIIFELKQKSPCLQIYQTKTLIIKNGELHAVWSSIQWSSKSPRCLCAGLAYRSSQYRCHDALTRFIYRHSVRKYNSHKQRNLGIFHIHIVIQPLRTVEPVTAFSWANHDWRICVSISFRASTRHKFIYQAAAG